MAKSKRNPISLAIKMIILYDYDEKLKSITKLWQKLKTNKNMLLNYIRNQQLVF